MNPPEVTVETGSDVWRTEVSVVFGAALFRLDTEWVTVAEGDMEDSGGKVVWDDVKGGVDDEMPFSGKELVYNNQNLPSPIQWINCSSRCRR